MSAPTKPLLRVLAGEALSPPPVWLMRQAGRYLPEYRALREKAGSFLDLCYNPDLAAEVTLQPIRRYGFDGAILFADILLVPQALGADLTFVQGEGPRLSTVENAADLDRLRPAEAIHDTLSPVYETVRTLSGALPPETTLIGFAGSPWTVLTYMVAGRGTPSQEPARRLLLQDPQTFHRLLDLITEATVEYLSRQISAGAEAVKLFDSWAGSLSAQDFDAVCLAPNTKIIEALNARHPSTPTILFARGAGAAYEKVARTQAACIAIDQHVPADWARDRLQPLKPVQGNLDPLLMVHGGQPLMDAARRLTDALSGGPHVFNLGHGITPDADPAHVDQLLKAIRG